MTTDLVTTEWFDHQKESRGLRFIQHEGTTYVPILDLASATGMRKRSLLKIVGKNPVDFERHTKSLHLETVRGLQETDCLDRDGAMLLMFKISTNHIRNPETKARLGVFKEWQIKKMGLPLALPAPKEPDYEAALRAVRFAKELASIIDTDPTPLFCQALDKFDLGMYGGLLVPKPTGAVQAGLLLPALPAPPSLKPKGYFNATDIGSFAGKRAEEINQWLYNNQFIIHDDENPGEWRITDLGREFGEERSYNPPNSLKLVWRCYWKPSILEKMNLNHPVGMT